MAFFYRYILLERMTSGLHLGRKMAECMDDVDPSVGFLYKTMLQRDPHKRRVKPVQKHLIQLNFGGLEDSSDDSDFEVPQHGSDGSDVDIDTDQEDGAACAKHSGSGSESASDDDSDEGEDEEAAVEKEDDEELSLGELLERAQVKATGSEDTTGSSTTKLKVTICCVCLGDNSEEEDEIVECDGCGVSVHEGCYGISESQSVASTESSASTEPWFCDACKAGVKPHCELCPNAGGIYKETDAGRWVHIVCALYIPGVAFGDVDRLSPVTLFEMPYSKWGARECSLCEDERFSRTGVCISCDAGMCRSYFHVTCAHREGLLSEASPDEEIADPFYAYCKQHGDKAIVRAKRRNYLAIQSHYRSHKDQEVLDEKEKLRVERKLNRHRQKYLIGRAKRPPSWVMKSNQGQGQPSVTQHGRGRFLCKWKGKGAWQPPSKRGLPHMMGVPKEKMPRLLTTSPSAMRRLMRKAELLGINTQLQTGSASKGDIRKKWHVAPALSVAFVGYYFDRNVRMKNMKSHLRELLTQRDKLQDQEAILRAKYDQLSQEVEGLRDSTQRLRQQGQKLWETLSDLAGKPLPLPEVVKPKKVMRSPSKKDTPRSPPGIIHSCGICHLTTEQHLLAKCDTCRHYYHLGCLNPPLTRMPKKTKLQGWQCSECVSSSGDEATSNDKNPNAPRRLREKIKEPIKFTPPIKEKMRKEKGKGKGRRKKAKKRLREDMLQSPAGTVVTLEEEVEREMPILKKERPCRLPKSTKQKDVRTECCVCNLEGDNNNLVRCDECKLCYHFHCLDPPLRKSPKQRGYAWHCTACDPTEGEPVIPVQVVKRRREIAPVKKQTDEDVDLEAQEPSSVEPPKVKDASPGKVSSESLGARGESLSDSDVGVMEEEPLPPQLQKEGAS